MINTKTNLFNLLGIGFISFYFSLMPVFLQAQQEVQKPITEKVEVTQAEIPVRVLLKGKPVMDLNAEDFMLLEKNSPLLINNCFLKRKVLNGGNSGLPRTLVMAFQITDYNQNHEKAINYLFEKILLSSDRLLIFINDSVYEYPRLTDITRIKQEILAHLHAEGIRAGKLLQEYFIRTESFVGLTTTPDNIPDLLKRYIKAWREYQNLYLMPKTDLFYYFTQYLENIKGPKWVLNFYQFQFFPRFRPNPSFLDSIREKATNLLNTDIDYNVSMARLIGNLLGQINSELEVSKQFPAEKIGKLFYQMDATFYNFIIKSTDSALLQNAEYNKICADLETLFKNITDYSGGKNSVVHDWLAALDAVASYEDVYYMLTYTPTPSFRNEPVKVKLKEKKYRLIYCDEVNAEYNVSKFVINEGKTAENTGIKVVDFVFKDRILGFTITRYSLSAVEGNPVGRIQVHIRLMDKDNKAVFDSSKVLTTSREELKISIPAFKNVDKGQYVFLLDVVDMFSNLQDNYVEAVVIQ